MSASCTGMPFGELVDGYCGQMGARGGGLTFSVAPCEEFFRLWSCIGRKRKTPFEPNVKPDFFELSWSDLERSRIFTLGCKSVAPFKSLWRPCGVTVNSTVPMQSSRVLKAGENWSWPRALHRLSGRQHPDDAAHSSSGQSLDTHAHTQAVRVRAKNAFYPICCVN